MKRFIWTSYIFIWISIILSIICIILYSERNKQIQEYNQLNEHITNLQTLSKEWYEKWEQMTLNTLMKTLKEDCSVILEIPWEESLTISTNKCKKATKVEQK